jgi:hypothetical protein
MCNCFGMGIYQCTCATNGLFNHEVIVNNPSLHEMRKYISDLESKVSLSKAKENERKHRLNALLYEIGQAQAYLERVTEKLIKEIGNV